jgi:hypothetical protein
VNPNFGKINLCVRHILLLIALIVIFEKLVDLFGW